MSAADFATLVLLAIVLIPAALYDVRYHRIPNWLSLSGWLFGLVAGPVFGGWSGFGASLFGLGIGLGLLFPLFVVGWMGAGDVKLVAAVGAIVGEPQVWWALAGIAVAGFGMSLMLLLGAGELRRLVGRISAMVGLSWTARQPTYIGPPKEQTRLVLPYAVPIAVGTFLGLAFAY